MPGGHGKIRPEDGKQFSGTYQPQVRWTEEKALQVGNELIEWLKEEDTNIFFNEFLYIKNDYHKDLICYLCKKFSSFAELIKKATDIQETKLVKFGCFDKLNAQMTKFTLINNHNWRDKSSIETDITSKGEKLGMNITVVDEDTKRDLEKLINNANNESI